jgi:pimeloyl-ACP methyl ester carboxylesterase
VASEFQLERDSVRLAGIDFGGDGEPVLLLHGLAGYAGEWAETAGWLSRRARVVALDARGHGGSERFPADVDRGAHVADAAFAVERLGLRPIVVVGQSLGGLTALLLAAEHPNLVRGLVMIEAGPHGGGDASAHEANVAALGDALRRWPVPFPSRDAAVAFFGGPSLSADAWAGGLERRDGGWWPRYDVEVMMRTLHEADSRSYWEQWERISCPALVMRAGQGSLSSADANSMVERGRHVTLVDVADAKHDLHLDRPDQWREALSAFLDPLDTQSRRGRAAASR